MLEGRFCELDSFLGSVFSKSCLISFKFLNNLCFLSSLDSLSSLESCCSFGCVSSFFNQLCLFVCRVLCFIIDVSVLKSL
jgi:hypothetical protein